MRQQIVLSSGSKLARGAVAVLFLALTAGSLSVIFPAATASNASTGAAGPASLSLAVGFTAPHRWRFGQLFDGYVLIRAPGTPAPAELGSTDGRTVVSVTPVPQAACRHSAALFAGTTAPGKWCLRLAGLRVGTTVQGKVASHDAQLTLKVAASDPIFPLPLLVTLLGLLVGILVLLFSPERLTPALRRWSLYAKLDKNTNAARSGQPAILGISRKDLRSWKGANGLPLTSNAQFVNSALEVLTDGRARLMNARKVLADKIQSSERLRDTPLLNRASAEASNVQASWSDFFDDMGQPRAKLPPEQELDRLTLANTLLDELDYLDRQLEPATPGRKRIELKYLRAEIGRTGEAPDIDRALAAAEDGIRYLRQEIRPHASESAYIYYESTFPEGQAYYRYAYGPRVSRIAIIAFLILMVSLTVALFAAGELKITTPVGVTVAGIFVAIPLLLILGWVSFKLAPYILRLLRVVHQRLLLPLARKAMQHLQGWRYALLRDFVTTTVVIVLLALGVTSVLVTTYAGREAFGKPLDYIALGLAATTVSIIAAVGGYITNRFHKPGSGSNQ